MLEELLNEINELREYKKKYEWAEKDKQRMSDLLFEYMTKEYDSKSFEERKEEHINNHCSACRNDCFCDCDHSYISEDIGKPSKSDKGWIPSTQGCKNFEWS